MKLNFISDVHIFEQDDEHAKLFLRFLDLSDHEDITHIYLLGDIFDLLVGDHHQNSQRYGKIFDAMKALLKKNKKIWYFEGNHDLHLTDFFKKEFSEYWNRGFSLCKNDLRFKRFNRRFYLCHGDYLTDHEPGYKKYRQFASWKIMEFIFEKLVPYSLLRFLAESFSKKSEKYQQRSFDVEKAREGFRMGAKRVYQEENKPNYLVAGHSHIKEDYLIGTNSFYLNNGFAPREKTYLQIDEEGYLFKTL